MRSPSESPTHSLSTRCREDLEGVVREGDVGGVHEVLHEEVEGVREVADSEGGEGVEHREDFVGRRWEVGRLRGENRQVRREGGLGWGWGCVWGGDWESREAGEKEERMGEGEKEEAEGGGEKEAPEGRNTGRARCLICPEIPSTGFAPAHLPARFGYGSLPPSLAP